MRDIKFRGKRVDNLEWVYGNLNLFDCKQGTESQIVLLDGTFFKVIPESVGQFTGCRDKNGVEIWEGDIVKAYDHPTGTDNVIGTVIHTRGAWGFANSIVTLGDYGTAWTEVIGSAYENPELLNP